MKILLSSFDKGEVGCTALHNNMSFICPNISKFSSKEIRLLDMLNVFCGTVNLNACVVNKTIVTPYKLRVQYEYVGLFVCYEPIRVKPIKAWTYQWCILYKWCRAWKLYLEKENKLQVLCNVHKKAKSKLQFLKRQGLTHLSSTRPSWPYIKKLTSIVCLLSPPNTSIMMSGEGGRK